MALRDRLEKAKEAARSAVNRMGFDVVRLRNSHGDLATHLQNVFALHRVDCVLDVGANAGQYGQFLRRLGFEGHIISFEPVQAVFERLQATAAGDPRWECHQLALGDTEERKTINVYDSTVFSSFLKVSDYSKQTWSSLEGVHPEEVVVTRLDSIFDGIKQRTGAQRFYLKMDTQGYDKNVFAGAERAVIDVRAMQSELSLIPVYKEMPKIYETLNAYHASGFFISGMYPINRDAKSLAVVEYDCVMVKAEQQGA